VSFAVPSTTPHSRPAPQAQPQEVEPRAARRRLAQAQHRAVLAGLFSSLQETVLSQSDSPASKYQVLRKAKKYIQELEQTLSSLLKMKGTVCKYLPQIVYAPCPFRYLYFYKHTVDLLREHGIVSAEEVPLPVVSTAISHLWQELSEERRDSILQYCSQRDFHLGPTDACQETACADGDVRDSGGNSEEASGSLVSTPEELFREVYNVISCKGRSEIHL
uniref:Stimulated by retinoic acid 8 n=1 Tax=Meleagris gallopavo TaxID=9103 RepID=G1NGU9_MELGA